MGPKRTKQSKRKSKTVRKTKKAPRRHRIGRDLDTEYNPRDDSNHNRAEVNRVLDDDFMVIDPSEYVNCVLYLIFVSHIC